MVQAVDTADKRNRYSKSLLGITKEINRIVATKVADILDEKYVAGSRKEIVNLIKRDSNIRRKIEGVLQNYPTYFSFKFEEIVYE